MPGTVVVMLPAMDARSVDARALAAACTAALREGECVIADAATPDAIAVATVTVRGRAGVHIDVDVRATPAASERHPSRDLSFRAADPERERWKSVGFAIASMSFATLETPEPPPPSTGTATTPGAGANAPAANTNATNAPAANTNATNASAANTNATNASATNATNTPARTEAPAKTAATNATQARVNETERAGPAPHAPPSAPPIEDESESGHRFRASGEFETGPGLTRGTWRLGGVLGAGYDFDDGFVGVDALGGYAANPAGVQGVDVSWLTFAAGASVAWTLYGVRGRLGALIGAREVRASERDAASGRQEDLTRWLPLGIARASLCWPAEGKLGIFSGVELRRTSGGTAVQSHGTYIGASPSLEFGLFLGVEVRP